MAGNVIRCFLKKEVATARLWLRINSLERPKYMNARPISTSLLNCKRRKTAEEKKSGRIIEYSPKKLTNKTTVHGVADIWRNMTVQELATSLSRDLEDVQEVMLYVKDANDLDPSSRLTDLKIIRDIATKCGLKTKIVAAPTEDVEETKERDIYPRPPPLPENLRPRPPVVTVMGHVDHGKTTLLDSLRGASVAAGEAGGITQHIGAFTVVLENGESVTFLDTPGHAAFTAMRARGANLTDIIVLVVAADDGVMEQTKEVIKLALDANVSIIVAVNKIDKPDADIERTKAGLIQRGLALEGHGGDIQVVGVSALHGTNLNELAEAVCAQATLMGLNAEYTGLVEAVVVESKTDPRRGKLSTAIVTRGTLRKGSVLVSGQVWAKVRGLFDHAGKPLDSATPGTPVEILGWRDVPFSGETILEVESEKQANSVIKYRQQQAQMGKALDDMEAIKAKEQEHLEKYHAEREARRMAGHYKTRTPFRSKQYAPDDPTPRVNIILKGDVHGSVEAILDVLETYDYADKCRLDIVHYGVGDVIDSDVELAKAFNAIIYAFSVKQMSKAAKSVDVRDFNIIYRLVDDLKAEIGSKLPPIEVEDALGEANVLQIFSITEGRKDVTVLGCRCTKGVLKKNAKFRLVRNGETIFDGPLDSMRHLKSEVDSIKKDVECGLRFQDNTVEPQAGDTLICYTTHQESQATEWDPGF